MSEMDPGPCPTCGEPLDAHTLRELRVCVPEEECKHELPVSSCGECRPRGVPDRVTDGVLIEQFRTAQYDGRCALESAHRIVAGTEIGLAVPEEGGRAYGWCCAACVRAVTG